MLVGAIGLAAEETLDLDAAALPGAVASHDPARMAPPAARRGRDSPNAGHRALEYTRCLRLTRALPTQIGDKRRAVFGHTGLI